MGSNGHRWKKLVEPVCTLYTYENQIQPLIDLEMENDVILFLPQCQLSTVDLILMQ